MSNLEREGLTGIIQREDLPSKEIPLPRKIGVGVVLLNPSGRLWTVIENESREGTGKNRGQVSILLESAKSIGGQIEPLESNVRAALAEALNDQNIHGRNRMNEIAGAIFTVEDLGAFTRHQILFPTPTSLIVCIPIVVICGTGYINPSQFHPASNGEVSPFDWMGIDEFLTLGNGRPLAQKVVETLKNNGVIKRNLLTYHQHPGLWHPVFPHGFSFSEHCRERDKHPDTQLVT